MGSIQTNYLYFIISKSFISYILKLKNKSTHTHTHFNNYYNFYFKYYYNQEKIFILMIIQICVYHFLYIVLLQIINLQAIYICMHQNRLKNNIIFLTIYLVYYKIRNFKKREHNK